MRGQKGVPHMNRHEPSRVRFVACCLTVALAALSGTVRAQTSTLPPTDISNPDQNQDQNSNPPPPPAMPPPAPSTELPPPPSPTPVEPMAVPPPAPMAVPPPAPMAVAAPAMPPAAEAVPVSEPIAGISDSNAFLRSPDGSFVLFPNGRFQTDLYTFGYAKDKNKDKIPNNTFLLRRARLELGGWIGSWVYFWLAGDFALGPAAAAAPVAPANIGTTDDYVALAPWNNLAILQVGQFDAPFTLENRTSDKYFDFMERSITVRAFGIPDNKEMGAMLHGFNDARNFYYSVSVLNGDGQNFKNADRQADWMGRAWVAPLSFMGEGPLHDVEIGASLWTGDRSNTLALASQTTQGGFTFLNFGTYNATLNGAPSTSTFQFRQVGRMNAVAAELNAPVAHRFGVRGEFVWKHNPLSEDVIAASGAGTIERGADLKGYSFYAEAWAWLLGDDRIIGDQQGLEPFTRYKKFGVRPIQDGVMVAARYEHLDENLTTDTNLNMVTGDSSAIGKTKIDSVEIGLNYWHSKRFRATFNGVYNHWGQGSGATPYLKGLAASYDLEYLFRLAIAL
jgi:phosphate-selective porin OprO and OprP